MKNEYYYAGGREFKRVNKRTARRAYNNGLAVLLRPSGASSDYYGAYDLRDDVGGDGFDRDVEYWESYNCKSNEYAMFYIPIKTIDLFTGGEVTYHTRYTAESYDYSYM